MVESAHPEGKAQQQAIEADGDFHFTPSVGTWLLPRKNAPKASEAIAPAFQLAPSVGTWLSFRLTEEDANALSDTDLVSAAKRQESIVAESIDFEDFRSAPQVAIGLNLTATPQTSAASPLSLPLVQSPLSTSSQQVIRLAPPPTPTASVGASSPPAAVVVLDELAEVTDKKAPEKSVDYKAFKPGLSNAELIGVSTVDDDEEMLLGKTLEGAAQAAPQAVPLADGIDSASDEDRELHPTPRSSAQPLATGARTAPTDDGNLASAKSAPAPSTKPQRAQDLASKAQQSAAQDHSIPKQVAPGPQRPAAALPARGGPSAASSAGDRTHLPARSDVCAFRVKVPAPYPGIQYRRSMSLTDRCESYAENGSTITGTIVEEGSGKWLRLNNNLYVPVSLGDTTLLEPIEVTPAASRAGPGDPGGGALGGWLLSWCSGCRAELLAENDDDIVVGQVQ